MYTTLRNTILSAAVAIATLGGAAHAQSPTPEELQQRIRDLEAKIAAIENASPATDLTEIKRQIDILTREIEGLKVDREDAAPTYVSQYGLGQAASKVYRADQGISFGGYGEVLYENFSSERDDNAASGVRDQADFLRAILYTGYKFSDRVIFNSEIEFEHGSTGLGGEVSVEFGYLDFLVRPEVNVRAGLVLVPMGLVNELHEPTAFLGSKRPDVERNVLPSTWRENGVGIFGDIGPVSYRSYVITGLNAKRFSSSGIRSGRQNGARSLAEDLAWVGRLDWRPAEGLMFGGSYYTGNSGQNEVTPSGRTIDGNVGILEVHGDAKIAGFALRGLWTRGTIDDVRLINEENNLTGTNSVGEEFGGWYAEAGYDLGALLPFRGEQSLIPFVRYEDYNTQKKVPTGFSFNRARDVNVFTTGINWKPIPQAIIKVDYQNYENEADTGVDQYNASIGYIF